MLPNRIVCSSIHHVTSRYTFPNRLFANRRARLIAQHCARGRQEGSLRRPTRVGDDTSRRILSMRLCSSNSTSATPILSSKVTLAHLLLSPPTPICASNWFPFDRMQGYARAFEIALGLAIAFEVATAAMESAAFASCNLCFYCAICALERCGKLQSVFVHLPCLNPMPCRTYGLLFLLSPAMLGEEDMPDATLVASLALPALGGAIDWKIAKPTILCSKRQSSPNLQGGVRRW